MRLASELRDLSSRTVATAPAADAGIEICDALNRLVSAHAELFRLIHWDGLTLVEAAQVCGIPSSTVRSRYHAAKRALRASLDSLLAQQAKN